MVLYFNFIICENNSEKSEVRRYCRWIHDSQFNRRFSQIWPIYSTFLYFPHESYIYHRKHTRLTLSRQIDKPHQSNCQWPSLKITQIHPVTKFYHLIIDSPMSELSLSLIVVFCAFFFWVSTAKHFQSLSVSSAPADTTTEPSGDMAMCRTLDVWPEQEDNKH